jgi:predicted transcriptional regulator YheO
VVVDEWCRSAGVARQRLSPAQRRDLVRVLHGRGTFDVRHSAAYVATVLGVSRATVYSLLKSVRAERAAESS